MRDFLHDYLEELSVKYGFTQEGEVMIFKLRDIRESKNLTRKELSELSGVHLQTITALEERINNPANAKLSTLLAICRALECKLVDLYPYERNIG